MEQQMCYVYWIKKLLKDDILCCQSFSYPITLIISRVKPNTDKLIFRPFLDENSIWQLFWDYLDPWPATGGFPPALCHFCIEFHWFAKSQGAGRVFSGEFAEMDLLPTCLLDDMKLLLKQTFESFQIEAYTLWECRSGRDYGIIKMVRPTCTLLLRFSCILTLFYGTSLWLDNVYNIFSKAGLKVVKERWEECPGQCFTQHLPWFYVFRDPVRRPSFVAGICAAAASSFRERLRLALPSTGLFQL